MLIGIFSDVHDNVVNLRIALDHFSRANVSRLIFCGDFCSPFVAKEMAGFNRPVDAVFGNNDGDRFNIARAANVNGSQLVIHGEYASLQIDGSRIAVTHYPFYGQALAKTGEHDAVFFGHTHILSIEKIKGAVAINPGETANVFGKSSIVLFETEGKNHSVIHF